jgi:DNA invertase Pin-like site-specific DNA recombinase
MKVGYSRVSTKGQDASIEVQEEWLKKAGCERIFSEHESGGKRDRKELKRAVDFVREGDVLVVTKLDRLSRSLIDLLTTLEKLKEKGAGFESLSERIETHTPAGKMMLNMLGSFAEFERELIRERVKSGLAHARRNGRVGGSKPLLTKEEQDAAIEMVRSGKTPGVVAKRFHVHRTTIVRLMQRAEAEEKLKRLEK